MKLYIDEYSKEITADVKRVYPTISGPNESNIMILFEDGSAQVFSFTDYKSCPAHKQADYATEYIRDAIEDDVKILNFSEQYRFYKKPNSDRVWVTKD